MTRVRIVNRSDRKLSIPHPATGVDLSWEPAGNHGDTRSYASDAAQYALDHFGPFLEVISPGSGDLTDKQEKEQEYWIGNYSGDPDAWESKPGLVWTKEKGNHTGLIANGNKQPATFVGQLGRVNKIIYTPKGFPESRTFPGYLVKIPPYSRIKVNKDQFAVLIQRDAEQSIEYSGRIAEARAPSGFEPELEDDSWTHDRMRVWLKLAPAAPGVKAGKDVCGPSEKELKAKLAADSLTGEELETALYDARYDLWVRCRLRAMNMNVRLPTEKDFNAALAREAKAEKTKAAESRV
jgi:hypothetical protein